MTHMQAALKTHSLPMLGKAPKYPTCIAKTPPSDAAESE